MIDAEGVIYDYPSGRALDGIGFVVRAGAVLALVGPNGAGKSTLLRCIAALDRPTQGRISVLGLDTRSSPRQIHAALGYLPDQFGLYDALTVRQCLIYAARSHGVDTAAAAEAAETAARRVNLSDRMDALAGALSRGLRQRLAIAQTIVHGPRVLLLDEPASGLDPEARHSLSQLIRVLAGDGMTLIVSSHILAELEDYCTEMLILRDGRVVGDGVVRVAGPLKGAQPAGVEPSPADPPVRVEVAFSGSFEDLENRLSALNLTLQRLEGDRAILALPPGVSDAEALARLVTAGLGVKAYTPFQRGLEEAYMAAAVQPKTTAVPEAGH